MKPTTFPEANTVFCIDQEAEGEDRGELPALTQSTTEGHTITTVWELTEAEKAAVAMGGKVALTIYSKTLPPVAMRVAFGATDNDRIDSQADSDLEPFFEVWKKATFPGLDKRSTQDLDLTMALVGGAMIGLQLIAEAPVMDIHPILAKCVARLIEEGENWGRRYAKFHPCHQN